MFTKLKSYPLSRNVETTTQTGTKYIHYGDIHTKKAQKINNNSNIPYIENKQYELLEKGDIILADASEDYQGIAEPAVIVENTDFKIVAGLHTIALRSNNSIPLYLYYLIKSSSFRMHGYRTGTGMKVFGITADNVLKFETCYPRLEEQLKISKTLDNMDQLITLHQRKINTLEAQKKAYLNVMFPKNKQTKPNLRFNRYIDEWEQRKLKELAVIDTGKAFKSEYFHKEGAYLVVTNKNIRDQKHNIVSQGDRIDITESTVLNRYLLSGENILITMDGVHIGKSGRYSDDNSVLAQRVARIRSENISFVDQVIQRNSFLRKMNKLSVGNAIKHISLKNISDYSLMAPTESEEKNNIGNFLEKLDIILSLYHSKLSILKQLKQVYLNKMFI